MDCTCQACRRRRGDGLPALPGVSVVAGMHITESDLVDPQRVAQAEAQAIETTRRAAMVMRTSGAPRRRLVSIRTLAEVVRIERDANQAEFDSLRRKVEELEQRVGFERRLGALETRPATSMEVDAMAPWEPRHSSWRGRQ